MTALNNTPSYEPPRLTVIGAVYDLTQLRVKHFGPTDGFTFQGTPISNASH